LTVGQISAIYFSLALNFLFGTHYVSERMQDEWFRDLCSIGGLCAYWICLFYSIQYGLEWVYGEIQ
jgi:hypothetical protein